MDGVEGCVKMGWTREGDGIYREREATSSEVSLVQSSGLKGIAGRQIIVLVVCTASSGLLFCWLDTNESAQAKKYLFAPLCVACR